MQQVFCCTLFSTISSIASDWLVASKGVASRGHCLAGHNGSQLCDDGRAYYCIHLSRIFALQYPEDYAQGPWSNVFSCQLSIGPTRELVCRKPKL